MKTTFICLLFCALSIIATAQKLEPLSIGFTTKIQSKELSEDRVINIYLPDGYNDNDTEKYPVIYMLDGGIQEDFLQLTGIVEYYTQPWVNRFAKSIVVGIENTNRRRDLTYAVPNLDFLQRMHFGKELFPQYGGSEKFTAFIQNELRPFINGHYRTANSSTIMGESLAGLYVTELYTRHRDMFDNYIIISPSLWWGHESLLQEIKPNTNDHRPINVYIGAPGRKEDTVMYNDAVKLNQLIRKTAGKNTKVYYDYLPNETHATVIHQAVMDAFRMFYKK